MVYKWIVILNAIKKKWPTELSYRDSPSVTDVYLIYDKDLIIYLNILGTNNVISLEKLTSKI